MLLSRLLGRFESRARGTVYRATAMDRVFADSRIIAVTGPSRLDPDGTRRTLSAAENASATPRLALEPDPDEPTWAYRNDLKNDVAIMDHLETDDLGHLLTAIRQRPGHRNSLHVLICGDYLAVDLSHGIGDGQMGVQMLGTFSSDPDGSRAHGLAVALPPNATWQALRRHYGAHPAALRQFWALRTTHKRRPETSESTRRIEDWESAKVSTSRHMSPQNVAALRTWAKTHFPGATAASVSVALWSAALRAENVDVDDRIMVLFNSRRYLDPEHHGAHGNFAVGIPLRFPADTSPAAIADTMRQVIDSGWPIAILGMSELKDAISSRRGRTATNSITTNSSTTPSITEVPHRLRLAVSDLGKLPMLDHLDWCDDGRPPQFAASLDPDGPDGITMLISEVAGGRTYTASYCSKFVDEDTVESALRRLCDDPLPLLQKLHGPATP